MANPRIIPTPDDFERKVKEYVELCAKQQSPLTITGLCLHLGFATKQSFYDYEKMEEFRHVVGKARMMVENEYEKRLHSNSPTGAIFALKQYGWSDKHELTGAEGGPLEIVVRRTIVNGAA